MKQRIKNYNPQRAKSGFSDEFADKGYDENALITVLSCLSDGGILDDCWVFSGKTHAFLGILKAYWHKERKEYRVRYLIKDRITNEIFQSDAILIPPDGWGLPKGAFQKLCEKLDRERGEAEKYWADESKN